MLPVYTASNSELLLLLSQQQRVKAQLHQSEQMAQLMNLKLKYKLLAQEIAAQQPTQAQLLAQLASQQRQAMMANQTQLQISNLLMQKKAMLHELSDMASVCSTQASVVSSRKTSIEDFPENIIKTNNCTVDDYHVEMPKLDRLDSTERELLGLCGLSKKIKKINECGHTDRPHYAKNMCNPCYHKYGRTKKPWRCNHEKLYAHGLCQNCYINDYNRKRNQKSKEDKLSNGSNPSWNEAEMETLTSTASTDEALTMEDKTAFTCTDEHEISENQNNIN